MRRRLVLLALAACLGAPPAAGAAAAPSAVFGLRAGGNPPLGYFVYHLNPGATRTGSVVVSNVGDATGTVHLSTADATTGRTSGTVYRTDARPAGAGAWVSLATSSVSLAPGAHATVPFTVHVPAAARPGQWVAGIVAEGAPGTAGRQTGAKTSVRIRIRNLTIVAVQVDVPGEAQLGFRFGSVATGGASGYQQLVVGLTGTGNVLSRPQGSVTVSDDDGAVRQTLRYTMDTFLPRTSIAYPLLLRSALSPGRYNADLVLRARPLDGGPEVVVHARRSFSVSAQQVKQVFTAAPPTGRSGPGSGGVRTVVAAAAGGAAGVLLLAAFGLLLARHGRRRRSAANGEDGEPVGTVG